MTPAARPADPASSIDLDATDRATRPGQSLLTRVPWWVWPLTIYALTRAINAVMIVNASRYAIPSEDLGQIKGSVPFITDAGTPAPGYFTSATNWDGQWYWEIAVHGYPTALPTDADGNVQQNPWAFYPLYPVIVRLVMTVTGLGFPVAGVIVSLVCGAAACVVLYRLVLTRTDSRGASIALIGFCAFTCAPVLQMTYTEGLALLLLVLLLAALVNQQFARVALLLTVLAFTRPIVLPLAAVLSLMALRRLKGGSRDPRAAAKLAALALWAGMLSFVWPFIAAAVTGRPNAYLETQRAWIAEAGQPSVVAFVNRLAPVLGGPWVTALVACLWAGLVVWIVTMNQPIPEMKAWSGFYALYLLSFVLWSPTSLRYYLLAFPTLWPLTRQPRTSADAKAAVLVCGLLVAVGVVSQWWWIRYCVTQSPDLVQFP